MNAGQEIQGISFAELADQFGTPLFVYDGDVLVQRYSTLRELLHPTAKIFYSLKANPNISVVALLAQLGAGAEVSSLAELITAVRAGVPASQVIFLGPGKSREELAACLDFGVRTIVAESTGELDLIDDLARSRGEVASVALRVNAGFSVKGSGLTMGGKPRQFGIDEDQLMAGGSGASPPRASTAAPPLAAGRPGVAVTGVHVYMGTRFLNAEMIAANTEKILRLADRLADKHHISLDLVDVGGGWGVAYFDGECDLDVAELTAKLNPLFAGFAASHPGTSVIVELGRYLTAPAGTYLTRVRYTKQSMGENFAITDGGTNHHMAAVGIGSYVKRNFPIALAGRPAEQPCANWTITGPLCTPADTLGKNVALPPVQPGDLIAVLRSGAYGPTASPGLFLGHGYPAEVLVRDGRAHLVRCRDTVADVMRGQRMAELGPAVAATGAKFAISPERTALPWSI